MEHDPYTLYVALSNQVTLLYCHSALDSWQRPVYVLIFVRQNTAEGEIYIDDGYTFNYEKKEFIHRKISMANNIISSMWVLAILLQPSRNPWELHPALIEALPKYSLYLHNPFQKSSSHINQISLESPLMAME